MQPNLLLRAAVLCLLLVTCFVVSYEWYWRQQGFPVSFNDDEALWAEKRSKVYAPKSAATVVIGSSRIKFGLDIPTWERLTGEEVVQLSMVGTSPRPLLQDLANDPRFKGKLIVDVTEGLFFNTNSGRTEKSARDGIKFYGDWTPAQKASGKINHVLESNLILLEKERFGLTSLLADLEIPNRPGVFSFPRFPKEFGVTTAGRQSYMTDRFLRDTGLQKQQTVNWTKLGALDRTPGARGDTLLAVFNELKSAIDKIRARGGDVLFVRTPASGPMEEATIAAYPRHLFWDPMLAYTATPGVHYRDYPATANFICPEWSHLSSEDAVTYTRHLVHILQQEKGWRFVRTGALAATDRHP